MKNLYWLALGLGTVSCIVLERKSLLRRGSWQSAGAANGSPVFTDFHGERPGTVHHITVADLPASYATESVDAGPRVVARPEKAWPQAPGASRCTICEVASESPPDSHRTQRRRVFGRERARSHKVYRGINTSGEPASKHVFTSGLTLPFGIAFYPPGPNPNIVYIANTNAVLRFPYKNGDLEASGPKQIIMPNLPGFGRLARRRPLDARHCLFAGR